MMNPHDAAHALARALRESNDFKELKDAQVALKADESARSMLIDFRGEQMKLQQQQMSGIEIAKEQQEKMEKLFEVINLNNAVRNYLHAEYRASVLLQDVHKIIGEAASEMIDPELIAMPASEENGED